jgi:phage gp46-like protein
MTPDQPLTVLVDGITHSMGMGPREPLVRAVIISLFTWGRAKATDELPGTERMGWWGDSYPDTTNDRIGSRLWLLARAKITAQTVPQAKRYAEEALAWLVADGVASQVLVDAERQGLSTIALRVQIVRGDAPGLDIRFNDVWSMFDV